MQQKLVALGGEADPARIALEQGGAELGLQLADGAGDRRLGDVQLGGCPADREAVGHRHEIADLAKGEVHLGVLPRAIKVSASLTSNHTQTKAP